MYRVLDFVAILSAAMLAGLMATLLSVMRKMWNQQREQDAARSFQDFLRNAATNRVLSTLTVIPILSAIAIAFIHVPNSLDRVYAVAGGSTFLVGFFLWTAVFNQPIYRKVETWDPSIAPPDGVHAVINRFHLMNIVRLSSALATSMLFYLAS